MVLERASLLRTKVHSSCIFTLCTSKVTFWRSFPQKLFLRVETWVAPQVEADTSKSGLLSAYECGKGGCGAEQNLKIRVIFGACLELCTKRSHFRDYFHNWPRRRAWLLQAGPDTMRNEHAKWFGQMLCVSYLAVPLLSPFCSASRCVLPDK